MIALALALVLAAALNSLASFNVTLVSKSSSGEPADANSALRANGGSISRDGRIAVFESEASNLPGGDGSTSRCYARNLRTGKTRLASVKSNGTPASGETQNPSVSPNGRYVGFSGDGDGLPGSDPGNAQQVWVHDLKTHETRLVSRATNGAPGSGGDSHYPSFSAGGRFVAFTSYAENLPGSDGDDLIYVRDLTLGKTILASRTGDGDPASADLYGQSISSDGRRVVFDSYDPDLPHGNGSFRHVYVRDLETGKTKLVDWANDGEVGNQAGADSAISGNGDYVAFASDASNLPGGGGTQTQVYLRDLRREKTVLVSRTNAGAPQEGDAEFAAPSGDGRYVAFRSNGGNLPGGNGSTNQIYVRDLREGKTRLISKDADGDPAEVIADGPSVSQDGAWVLFETAADNLGGNSGITDVFRAGPIG